jgi:FkbM family methyltransferase
MSSLGRYAFSLIERLLARRGYVVQLAGSPPRGFSDFLAFARRCGVAPETVYDIGVGEGTPWLYDAFPGARLVLVEALDVFRPQIEKIVQRTGATCHFTALGAKPGQARFRVQSITASSSSFFGRSDEFRLLEEGTRRDTGERFVDVPVTTLDSIAVEKGPCVVKLDVEGSELAVIAGGHATLARAQLVLLELSVLRRFEGEPSFAEAIATMDRLGFEVFDFPELTQTSPHGPLSYVDVAFVPKNRSWRVSEW